MTQRILVLNAGSSSLKFATFAASGSDVPSLDLRGQLAGIGQGEPKLTVTDEHGNRARWGKAEHMATHADAVRLLIERLLMQDRPEEWLGAGHRIVHGGARFSEPVKVTPETLKELVALIPLAPLHQPHNVAPIEALQAALPELPQVACFDTAFHACQPEIAMRFALPEKYWQAGLRRYGFHGLSYEAILQALPAAAGGVPKRLVVAHLGNGASMAAINEGKCIATTMGFSTLDGLVMGTRAGSIDPGVLLHLLRDGMSREELEKLLYHESGVKGVSGLTADMKTLLESSDPKAQLAIDVYCYRIGRELGSLAAALGGLDALVFTGGVGENAAPIRAQVCTDAAWLGLHLDKEANRRGDARISAAGSRVAAWIVATDEELTIARHTQRLLRR
ncbi:acetate/propionate family kinase [Dongia deserti]|uniref:acetate/propionate family kinase n=1 Tax=Dongia deserti TaxID=2268030 RepID=UPI000E64E268|nr:acetate/propionate family kinase [Dongia deserti]